MTETNATATADIPETVAGQGTEAICSATKPPAMRDYEAMLRDAGLRPTQQRIALAQLLFSQGDRHFTAEMVYNEATQSSLQVSLATVYNTLNLFAKLGLLRAIGVDGSTTYFDTKTDDHHHFFVEGAGEIRDIPTTEVRIGKMCAIPAGYEISHVDLMIKLRKREAGSSGEI